MNNSVEALEIRWADVAEIERAGGVPLSRLAEVAPAEEVRIEPDDVVSRLVEQRRQNRADEPMVSGDKDSHQTIPEISLLWLSASALPNREHVSIHCGHINPAETCHWWHEWWRLRPEAVDHKLLLPIGDPAADRDKGVGYRDRNRTSGCLCSLPGQ
jgi:hypothetical protein